MTQTGTPRFDVQVEQCGRWYRTGTGTTLSDALSVVRRERPLRLSASLFRIVDVTTQRTVAYS